MCVTVLSAFPGIFYLSATALLGAVWALWLIYGNDLMLWNALVATVCIVWAYAWFVWPFAYTYRYNAFMFLLSFIFTLSLLTGLKSD